MSATEEPRRLTPTERLHEVTLAALTRAPSLPEHSIDLKRNSKGVHEFAVTVRGHDLEAVLASAQETYGKLIVRFPYAENGGAK